MSEYSRTGSKKPTGTGRGMARASLDLIEAMVEIVKITAPITGRGIGYKLFTERNSLHEVLARWGRAP